MSFIQKRVIMCIFLVTLGYPFLLNTRVYDARSDSKFYDCLMKKPLAVALFYEDCKSISCYKESRRRKGNFARHNQLDCIFSTLGKQGYFMKGGVTFIRANTKYDTICLLAESFYIHTLPSVILFKNGVQLRDEGEKPIMLTGRPTFQQLSDFIRNNLEEDIEQNIEDRARELQKLREAERWSYLWYRPYLYGGCWPCYGGCGGCYPGCGWGGGWGGCCRPRPCWGVGVGFSNCGW